jgi:hypothetical protein
MKLSNIITTIGLSFIILYTIITILKFYGISENIYSIYLLFYIFIIISLIVLPNNYPHI